MGFKAINFNECEKIIKDDFSDKKIDLLNKDLLKLLKVNGDEVTYINNHNKDGFRYLHFKNNKKIKINIISRIFYLVEIIDDSLNNSKNKSDISLKVCFSSKKEKLSNIPKSKEEEKIEVKSDKDKKDEINLIDLEDIQDKEEKSENLKIEDIKEKSISIIEKVEQETIENNIIDIPLEILFLFNVQKKELKSNEIYYLCNQNIINYIIEQIENNFQDSKDINEVITNFLSKENYTNFIDVFENIQNILKKFKQENPNIFENTYNFNIIDKQNFILEQKEIEYNNKDIKKIPFDFILIKQEISDLLIKLFNLGQKEEIDEIFNKANLLKVNNENLVINICETNTIYICKIEENNKKEYFNVFFILSYNTVEIYLNEKILLEKNNFGINLYLQERKTNINKYFQIIYDENNIDIGYFINLNEPNIEEQKDEQKEELILEDNKKIKEEQKGELIEETKEEIKEEEKVDIENEVKEEIKEEEKVDIEKEVKEEIKEEEKDEDKDEVNLETNGEIKEEQKDEIKLENKEEKKEEQKEEIENKDIDNLDDENNIPLTRIGLSNTNSNSYLNSVLHCIYNIKELTNFFISDKNFLNLTEESFSKEDKIILNDIEITKDSLSFKYLEVLFYLYHKKKNNKYIKYYSPKNFLEYIQNEKPEIFQKNKESNPKELLSYLIKKLKEELKEKESIKIFDNEEDFILMNSLVENEELLYKKYLSNFKFKNNSIIDKYLAGIELISFTCDKCKEQEKNFQHFYNIEFPLSKIEKILMNLGTTVEKISLEECFNYYFKTHITSQNCKKCKNNNNNILSQKIFLSPKILVISIGNIREKRDLFKLDEEINLNEFMKDKNDGYKLNGIIVLYNQTGSSERYYFYCYNNEDNKWYCYVDEYIYEINDDIENEINKANRLPYILFYKDKSLFN